MSIIVEQSLIYIFKNMTRQPQILIKLYKKVKIIFQNIFI
jgi:hypothetical protein